MAEQNSELDIIFSVTSSIIELKEKLKILEKNGLTESKEFKSIIERLKSSLMLEKSLYTKLNNNPNYLTKLLILITWPSLGWDIEFDICTFCMQNKISDLTERRVILRIFDKLNSTNGETPLSEVVIGTANYQEKYAKRLTNLSVEVRNDYIKTFLYLLNLEIAKNENKYIRDRLIDIKYNISTLYDFIECDLLQNNFAINTDLYLLSTLMADRMDLSHTLVDALKERYVGSINKPLWELAEMKKSDINDEKKFFEAIVYLLLIRVNLLFMGNKGVRKLEKLLQKNLNDNALYLIKDALSMHKTDITIPRTISLKLEKN